MQLLLMTSFCILQECPQSFAVPLQKAMKWLTVEAIVVSANTAADPPTSPMLLFAKISKIVQSGHILPVAHVGSLLNMCHSIGHDCIPSHRRWRSPLQEYSRIRPEMNAIYLHIQHK